MNRQSWLLNLNPSKTHPASHAVFLARFISTVSLGLLGMAVLVQIQVMTQPTWQVGLSMTLIGSVMFTGLMVGGTLVDRCERREVILLARETCGTGFIGLCLNVLLSEPSLPAICLLDLWDGSFASLDVVVLLAAAPAPVGRENLMQAGAITMLTVRLGSVTSPMLDGVLFATGGVAWDYGLTVAGTLITLLPLLSLPVLPPPSQPREHPLKSLLVALRFLFTSPLIGDTTPLGGLLTMVSVAHMLCSTLVISWHMSGAQIGPLYATIPPGAAMGASTSGQLARSVRLGLVMLTSTVVPFLAVGLFGLMPVWQLGVARPALSGRLSTVSSLSRYTPLQTQTPGATLRRINGLWTAQNVTGDAIGAASLGGLGVMTTSVTSASVSGPGLVITGLLLLLLLGEMRRFRQVLVNI